MYVLVSKTVNVIFYAHFVSLSFLILGLVTLLVLDLDEPIKLELFK